MDTPSRQQASRRNLMAGLYLIGVLNGVIAQAWPAIVQHGAAEAAAGLFGMDAVVLTTCFIGMSLSLSERGGPMTGRDLAAALAFALVVLVPHRSAGWVALGLLGLYGWTCQRTARPLAAAGAVFLAISLHEAWARLALAALTPVLTRADAALTAWALTPFGEVVRIGNVVTTPAGYQLVIVAACVSFNAVAQGLLACFAFTRFVRPRLRRSEIALWAILAAVLVGLNLVRLVASGLSLEVYAHLHDGAGRTAFGLIVLAVSLAVAAIGVRHDLWPTAARR